LQISEEVFERQWGASQLGAYVGGEVYKASTLLAKSPYHRTQFTSDLIGRLVRDVSVNKCCDYPIFWQVRPSIGEFAAIESLKSICLTQLINSDKFLAEKRRAKHLISRIFEALRESGSDLLPEDWRVVYGLYRDDEVQRNRVICDFVSGMTNSYCIEFYERLYGVRPPSIHKP
jgi:dGTPase